MFKKLLTLAVLTFVLIIGISCSEEKKVTSTEKETFTDEYKAYLEATDYLCQYYQKYIWKESEREYGKKQYRYTEEKLQKIKALKDEGKALCDSDKFKEGEAKLIEAITIINYTMMK